MAAVLAHTPAAVRADLWFDEKSTTTYSSDTRPGEDAGEWDDSYNPTTLFPLRMLQVLYDMGYDQATRDKVLQRVQNNLIHVHSQVWTSEKGQFRAMDDDEVKQEVKDTVVDGLLNKENLKSSGLELNSNEPVLMIGLGKMHYRTPNDMRLVKNEALYWLRENGIVPCRVYVRSGEDVKDENQFSLMLLNVVNTDIGGPSMVQLLDAAFHGDEWKKDLMSKEAWQGRDLVWIDESGYRKPVNPEISSTLRSVGSSTRRDVSPTTTARVGSQRLLETMLFSPESRPASPQLGIHEHAPETKYIEPQSPVVVETSDVPVQESEIVPPADQTTQVGESEDEPHFQPAISIPQSSDGRIQEEDDSLADEDPSGREAERSDHPAMKYLMDVEATRSPIRYPTWTHRDESDSLVDLIRYQSLTVKESDPDVSSENFAASQEGVKSPEVVSGTASEDDFVVVQASKQ